MRARRVRALLMGGQACVFYGAAEFSRDTDLAIVADAANLARLRRALADLQAEFTSAGRAEDFEAMKHTLTMGREDITHAQLAEKLGCAEGAARVAVHRLRKRYRELFREHIAATLSAGEDLDEEVRHVIAVLGR